MMSVNETKVINITLLGRGGMGVVTCAEIIAEAAFLSGNFVDVHAYPSFGAERRGAPVQAYAKLSREDTIWDRAEIEHPNILIIFDESVLNQDIASTLEQEGFFIINSEKEPEFFIQKYKLNKKTKIIVGNISQLAIEKNLTIDGNPVINTPILGLFSRVMPQLKLDYFKEVVLKRMGEKIGKLNFELIEKGYTLAKIL
jgi:2-oxoacid:acceptor oxidoreductase gamma subunit (pyruvate/2-ketoisovalerate family)